MTGLWSTDKVVECINLPSTKKKSLVQMIVVEEDGRVL